MKLFGKSSGIKIESDDLKDAKLSSQGFDDESIKKRAFINILGARLAIKTLFSKKIQANNVYSLYTIQNFLEEFDIADIYYERLRIDVRLVFNREEIFIPKSHFKYDLLPDLYLVLELKEDFSVVEPLGFFEPRAINKENENDDFYFFESEKLTDIKELKNVLKKITPKTNSQISQENFNRSEELLAALMDKEISQDDKLFLFNQMAGSLELRKKTVEFENFEFMSKKVGANDEILNDGVLDIIGAQSVFEDPSLDASDTEIKAEVIGEVLDGLLDDDLEQSFADVDEELVQEFGEELSLEQEIENVEELLDNQDEYEEELTFNVEEEEIFVEEPEFTAELDKDLEINIDEIADIVGADEIANIDENDAVDSLEEIEGLDDLLQEIEQEEINSKKDEKKPKSEGKILENSVAALAAGLELGSVLATGAAAVAAGSAAVVTAKAEIAESVVKGVTDVVTEAIDAGAELLENAAKENKSPEINFDSLEELPDLDLNALEDDVEKIEDKKQEEKSEDVFSLDNFDFDSLKEDNEAESQDFVAEKISFDDIGKDEELSVINDAEQLLSESSEDSNLLELEELPQQEDTVEVETEDIIAADLDSDEYKEDYMFEEEEIPSEVETEEVKVDVETETEDFMLEVDDLLKDINLSDEEKELLGESINFDEFVDDASLTESETAVSSMDALTDLSQEYLFTDENSENSDENDTLKLLFTGENASEMPEMAEMAEQVPVSPTSKDKKMVVAAAVAGVVLVSFVIGGSIVYNSKNKANLANKLNAPEVSATGLAPAQLDPNASVDKNLAQAVGQDPNQQAVQPIPGENQQAENRDMGQAVSDVFSSEPVNATISKIAWEVPEDLAYNDGFRSYLQIAGKNLKLNLQNDLLLATEMAYSNKVVVDLVINQDGSLRSENIITSSGSKQIDNIVLQSVKDTLKYLKMPSSELSGNSADATLIINF